jgi:hypothetical protein
MALNVLQRRLNYMGVFLIGERLLNKKIGNDIETFPFTNMIMNVVLSGNDYADTTTPVHNPSND